MASSDDLITTSNYFKKKSWLFDAILRFGVPAQEVIQSKRFKPVEPTKFILDKDGIPTFDSDTS